MRGHPAKTSEYHDDTEYELLTKSDPEPADREVAGRQHAVTAALASVRAEGLEPGGEDLALFAKVAAGRLLPTSCGSGRCGRARRSADGPGGA